MTRTQKRSVGEIIGKREFVSVATCDLAGMPNAAPKFVYKIEGKDIYLVDYTIGRTWKNLTVNPRVSISVMDNDTLTGYQLNGAVEIIDSGSNYDRMRDEVQAKKIDLTAQHIIEAVRGQQDRDNYEVSITESMVMLKVSVREIAEINPQGSVVRYTTGRTGT